MKNDCCTATDSPVKSKRLPGVNSRTILITTVAFILYFVLDDLYFNSLRNWLNSYLNVLGVSHLLSYSLHGIPLLIGLFLIHRTRNLSWAMGTDKSWLKALVFSLLCTLPMFLGFALMYEVNWEVSLDHLLISVVAAAFFEELYFRGFLFGQLYRFGFLGFVPAVFFGAVLFASLHLYQSDDLLTLGGIFLITFMGSIIFAWVYTEWEFNLWVPVFLHFCMNLSWSVFNVDDNALGGLWPNIFRIGTLLLVIGLTWLYKRKYFGKLQIDRATLWLRN